MAERRFERLTPAQLRPWLQAHPGALRLDAREACDFEQGHLPGSLRLDGRNHEALLMRESRTRPVFVACYRGQASQTYAQMFSDFGFATVADLVGGREAWLRELPPALRAWLDAEGYADAQAPGRHGNTPLMHAAWRGRDEVLGQLLELGVDLKAANGDGNSALWLACVSGEPARVERLLDAGLEIDHANATGATCLMYAASSSKPAIVRTLLARGANPALRSQDGFTALDMAASFECLQLLRAATPRVCA